MGGLEGERVEIQPMGRGTTQDFEYYCYYYHYCFVDRSTDVCWALTTKGLSLMVDIFFLIVTYLEGISG